MKSVFFENIKRELKNAFSIRSGGILSDAEVLYLEKIKEAILKRKMKVPSIMFFESVKPLNFFVSEVMVFLKPILSHIFDPAEYEKVAGILEKRSAIEYLIKKLEESPSS